ncbi:methyl-accepting chemotaxis citrate transducer (Citrate chemorecitrate transducer protein) [Candidatus Magnetoovum chiemensis]|nr:methyl-accepting chemotaxis citrate transducer (Citrate chemorecitrate transducer protein) [Candidatus Magnetoovum chiemensis]
MGIGAVLANMLVLFILVKLIVERPLYYLTHTIDEIRAGKNPDIRWGHRKDQIGVLSGAILNFKDALSKIREENERKAKESIIIDEIFAMINSIVQTLEKRAKEMVNCADTLYTLAATTGNQSQSVHLRANDTAVNTDNVSQYTNHLKDAVQDITSQILNQKQLVNSIIEKNIESHSNIKQLNFTQARLSGLLLWCQPAGFSSTALLLLSCWFHNFA